MSKETIKDNYHTMDDLYNHRTILFAILCRKSPTAWKSKRHYDGSSEDGWFIAGIETPFGQITYHQKNGVLESIRCTRIRKS